MRSRTFIFVATLILIGAAVVGARQAAMSRDEQKLYKQMLADIRTDIEKNYYDKTFRGIDLNAHFGAAAGSLAKATTTNESIDIITAAVFDFNDSHTRFYTPPRATRADYGWTMAAVGDVPLVMSVDAESDAAKRGLTPGDRILALNRFQPSRANLWQIRHYYGVVRPQAQQHVIVRKPDGREQALDIASKVERVPVMQVTDVIEDEIEREDAGADDTRSIKDTLVWRMKQFRDDGEIGPFIGKARSARALVLDLRGNPGGYVDGLKALVGWTFDHEVRALTLVNRKGEEPAIAKPRSKPFLGQLVVIVDSRSASAAEIFARIVQIEKRGTVIGDRTRGAVMVSRVFPHEFGIGNVLIYATSVTVADARMSDGGSLEHVGVKPDELVLPAPADLAAGRDPVLARAVALAGGSITPEEAGKLFPRK